MLGWGGGGEGHKRLISLGEGSAAVEVALGGQKAGISSRGLLGPKQKPTPKSASLHAARINSGM